MPLLQSQHESAEFSVNFAAFHLTRRQPMPTFSAREYSLRRKLYQLCRLRSCINLVGEGSMQQTEQSGIKSFLSEQQRRDALTHLLLSTSGGGLLHTEDLKSMMQALNWMNEPRSAGDERRRTLAELDQLLELLTGAASASTSRVQTCAEYSAMNQCSLDSNATCSLLGNQGSLSKQPTTRAGGLGKLLHLFQQNANTINRSDSSTSSGASNKPINVPLRGRSKFSVAHVDVVPGTETESINKVNSRSRFTTNVCSSDDVQNSLVTKKC